MSAPTWVTRDGRRILVSEMSPEHIKNSAALMLRQPVSFVINKACRRLGPYRTDGYARNYARLCGQAWPGGEDVLKRARDENLMDIHPAIFSYGGE